MSTMYMSVNGHYDGTHIVIDEEVSIKIGQKVIVTILEPLKRKESEEYVDLKKYMGRGEKIFQTDAGDYIKELRD